MCPATLDANVQDARTGMPTKPAGSLRVRKSVGGGAWRNTSLTTKKAGELFSTRVKASARHRKNGKYGLRTQVSTNSRGRTTATTPSGMLSWEVSVAGTKKYAGHRGYTITCR